MPNILYQTEIDFHYATTHKKIFLLCGQNLFATDFQIMSQEQSMSFYFILFSHYSYGHLRASVITNQCPCRPMFIDTMTVDIKLFHYMSGMFAFNRTDCLHMYHLQQGVNIMVRIKAEEMDVIYHSPFLDFFKTVCHETLI